MEEGPSNTIPAGRLNCSRRGKQLPRRDRSVAPSPLTILFQAQQDGATELVVSGKVAELPVIKYKVDDVWYNMSPPPSDVLPKVLDELERLADLADSAFPKDGKIDVQFSGVRLKWRIRVASLGADCVLTPIS